MLDNTSCDGKMEEEWRLLDLGQTNPKIFFNVFPQLIVNERKKDVIKNTLYFGKTAPIVWCGLKTNISTHVNIGYCREKKISIIKGVSHGGCVFCDEDTLHLGLIVKESPRFPFKFALNLFLNAYRRGLKYLGINSTVSGNDLLVNEKKVSGVAALIEDIALFECSTNLRFDYNMAEKVLTAVGMENKNLKNWVSSLDGTSYIQLKKALIRGFESRFNVKLKMGEPTESEWRILHALG